MLMILSLCGCLGQPCFQSSLFQPASPKGPCSEVLLALALEAHHGLGSGRAPPQESHSPAGKAQGGVFPETPVYSTYVGPRTEKAMAPHSSTLAWKIPGTEEPSRLRSMGSLRVGHD